MSYDISFKVKVEDSNLWVPVGDCDANITWNLREMIVQSTGLSWNNTEDNGLCIDVMPAIYKGLHELRVNPKKYKQYESPNGWGTLQGCIHFFVRIIDAWEDFVNYNEDIANYAHFWIE